MKVIEKKYKRLYLEVDTIQLLYNLVYTKKTSGDFSYTLGDAIKEGLESLASKENLKQAPESFINSRGPK